MTTARQSRTDRGSVTAFVLLLTVCLVALVGLVSEGGQVLSAREAAVAEAEQAARAGVAVLTASTIRAGGIATGGTAAAAAAEDFMSRTGHRGMAVFRGGAVTATVTPFFVSTPLLALVGVASIAISATATARPVDG